MGHRYLELVAQALDDAGSSQLDVPGASVEMITSSAALRRSSSSIARSAALGSPTVPVAAMPSAAAQVSASSRHSVRLRELAIDYPMRCSAHARHGHASCVSTIQARALQLTRA